MHHVHVGWTQMIQKLEKSFWLLITVLYFPSVARFQSFCPQTALHPKT